MCQIFSSLRKKKTEYGQLVKYTLSFYGSNNQDKLTLPYYLTLKSAQI